MYCTSSDVASFLNFVEFNANTSPTLTQVNNLITMISDEIDYYAKINSITFKSSDLSLLKKKTAVGVAGLISITFLNNNQSAGSLTNEFLKEYRDFLANFNNFFKQGKINKISSNVLDGTIEPNWFEYDYFDKD